MEPSETFTREMRDQLYRELLDENGEGICAYCRKRVNRSVKLSDPRRATLDHVVPKKVGGKVEFGNIAIACRPCNSRKGTLSAELFLRIRRKL